MQKATSGQSRVTRRQESLLPPMARFLFCLPVNMCCLCCVISGIVVNRCALAVVFWQGQGQQWTSTSPQVGKVNMTSLSVGVVVLKVDFGFNTTFSGSLSIRLAYLLLTQSGRNWDYWSGPVKTQPTLQKHDNNEKESSCCRFMLPFVFLINLLFFTKTKNVFFENGLKLFAKQQNVKQNDANIPCWKDVFLLDLKANLNLRKETSFFCYSSSLINKFLGLSWSDTL